MFFSSPLDFGPGRKMGGGTLLGGININLIYRIYTGGKFNYLNLEEEHTGEGAPAHEADLNVQKHFRLGGVNTDVFVEMFNVFNQRDAGSVHRTDYMWWGLQQLRPDDANYQAYGDLQDRSRYIRQSPDYPRGDQVEFLTRLNPSGNWRGPPLLDIFEEV